MAKHIATGINAFLFIDGNKVGFVTGCSWNASYQIAEARVIGHLYPVSQDVQGYEATLSIESFYPKKDEGRLNGSGDKEDTYASDEKNTAFDFVPKAAQIMGDDGVYKIDDIELKSTDNATTLIHLKGAVVESNSMQVQAGGYATGGVTFRAIMPVDA